MPALHPDPERQARLRQTLQPVCASVSAGDQVQLEQLKRIAGDPTRNPLNYLTKNNQSRTNTCAANAGEYCLSTYFWNRWHQVRDFSRLWLYLQARLVWQGSFADEGTSIPSVVEVLTTLGVPLETSYPWQPDQSRWPSVSQFRAMQTPGLTEEAGRNRLQQASEVSHDFDVSIARVLLGDPIFWGTGWPFTSGASGHATCLVSARWDDRIGDFIGLCANSHLGHEVFECTRRQFQTVMRENRFGQYHFVGATDLRFRLDQMVM